jgi:UDP-glucuronate decarboxylase
MTILVTGGAGFIGTNLVRYLINLNKKVICVDNLSSGSKKNIKDLLKNPLFIFKKMDIEEMKPTDFDEYKIEEIYHLACPASPPYYQTDPIKTIKTCVIGTMNCLELAKAHNARILLTSTSEVYGDPKQHPQKESYRGNVNCTGPRACYDEGKRLAETLMFEYYRMYGVQIRVVRIFNTYGEYMDPDDGRVISNFINQALAKKPLTIYGDGTQTRSFCYVSDMVLGLVKMMAQDFIGPVNLGNPIEYTIEQLCITISSRLGTHLKTVNRMLPEDDPTRRKPDITVAKSKLNWEPKVGLAEGLRKTIAYYTKLRKQKILKKSNANKKRVQRAVN